MNMKRFVGIIAIAFLGSILGIVGFSLLVKPEVKYVQQAQDSSVTAQTLGTFTTDYINALSQSYHYGFGVACISLIASMIVFWAFKKYYKSADLTEKQKAASDEHKDQIIKLTPKQTKDRLIALGLIFFVVIFF